MKRLFLCFFIFLFVSEFVMASEYVNVKEQNKISGSYRLMENINSRKPYLESHFNVYLEVMSEVNSLIHELITSDEVLMRNKVYSSIKKKIALLRYIVDRGNTVIVGKSNHQIDPAKETLYKCKRCNGKDSDCKFCSGDGWSWTPENVVDCTLCDGKGTVGSKDCPACNGFGSPDSMPDNPLFN